MTMISAYLQPLFSGFYKDRGFCKHKINSLIDEKMRDLVHKIMGATKTAPEKKSFCSEVHRETYAVLLYHNLPKTK